MEAQRSTHKITILPASGLNEKCSHWAHWLVGFFWGPKKGHTILAWFYVRLRTVPITHSLTYKNTMQYSSIMILPTNRKIKKITDTPPFLHIAYNVLDSSTHDNKTFNLYTKKMIPYSSITILPTNCKIKKITHTAFFSARWHTMPWMVLHTIIKHSICT